MINSKKDIVAFGCSVTHGCELVSGAYDTRNIPGSYPNQLADQLGVACENLAMPGCSNEYIFHRILDTDLKDRTVIVCWTSLVRECWQADGLHWFFIPNWGACFRELTHDTVRVHPRIPNVVADDEVLLNDTATYYDFFMRFKTDAQEYQQRLSHYHDCLQLLCKEKNIDLIELSCIHTQLPGVENIDGEWTRRGLHPSLDEHRAIADQLRSRFE